MRAQCEPAQPNDCGAPLAWPKRCLPWALAPEGSAFVEEPAVRAAFERAAATWRGVDCGAETSPMSWMHVGPIACDKPKVEGALSGGVYVRTIDDGWAHPGVYALTTLTFDVDTRAILGAVVDVDTSSRAITTSDTIVEVDLEGLFLHELGHVLGLAHASEATSTMFAEPPVGSLSWRSLASDDVAGACAVSNTLGEGGCNPGVATSAWCGQQAGEPAEPSVAGGGCACALGTAGDAGSSSAPGGAIGIVFLVAARARRRA